MLALGACADPPTSATESTTESATETSEGGTSEVGTTEVGTTEVGTTEVATSDTSESDATTGDETSGIDEDACPELLPAPTSCDAAEGACGNATPIAGAERGFLDRELAITSTDVWFIAHLHGCAALYRVPKRGGDAQRVRLVTHAFGLAADDEVVYLLERTLDPDEDATVTALVDGDETVIGEVDRYSRIRSSRGGVIIHDGLPSVFYRASPDGLSLVGATGFVSGAGSTPDYDGERLFFNWRDNPDKGDLDRVLLGLAGETYEVLASNARVRSDPLVAVDDDDVFFATGGLIFGESFPGGISRVAKSGGSSTPLLPEELGDQLFVDQVLVDEDDVYYRSGPYDLFAVPKTGGTPRHVWHGGESEYALIDANHLFFRVSGPPSEIPIPGREFIVRVEKSSALP